VLFRSLTSNIWRRMNCGEVRFQAQAIPSNHKMATDQALGNESERPFESIR
jgi:hypothetical protein